MIRRFIRFHLPNDPAAVGRAELEEDGSLRPIEGALAHHLDEVSLLPPATPTKIIGVGLNYHAHAREMGKALPNEPLLFLMPSTAVIASGASIVRPRGFERVDYEGELAMVFGRRARNIRAEDASDVIAGYCCLNDVTVRDLQGRDVQYTRAKGFDTFAPLGPCLATGLPNPQALEITTRVDGKVRQRGNTADMIFDLGTIVATVTRVMTMLPGDVITTGTPPGVGQARVGATIEVEIEGIGILRNVVGEEAPPAL
ncbi:MAG: fumarylacetoacetate hydrolase family protein [Deltaproteobacteria bacterium]|nr:fumarylacetoacetate hydrolase family protein [Deltaproteobacteria bacterium]